MSKTTGLISGIEISLKQKENGIEVVTKIPRKFFDNPSGFIRETDFKVDLEIKDAGLLPESMETSRQILKNGSNKVYIRKAGYEITITLSQELLAGKRNQKIVDSGEFTSKFHGFGTVTTRYEKFQDKGFFKFIIPLSCPRDRVRINGKLFSLEVDIKERPRGRSLEVSFYLPYTEKDKRDYRHRTPKKVRVEYCGRSGYVTLQPSLYMASDWENKLEDKYANGFIAYKGADYSPGRAFGGMRA